MAKFIPSSIRYRGRDNAIHIPRKVARHFYNIEQRQGVMMYNDEFYLRLSEMTHTQKMYLISQNIKVTV